MSQAEIDQIERQIQGKLDKIYQYKFDSTSLYIGVIMYSLLILFRRNLS